MRVGLAMCSIVLLGVLGVGCAAEVGSPDESVGTASAAASLPPPPPPVETTNCDDEDSASDQAEANKAARDLKQADKGHLRVCKNDKKKD